VQAGGEGEVAEVVRGELQLSAIGGALQAAGDESGVVDQQVQWALPRCGDVVDGSEV